LFHTVEYMNRMASGANVKKVGSSRGQLEAIRHCLRLPWRWWWRLSAQIRKMTHSWVWCKYDKAPDVVSVGLAGHRTDSAVVL